MKAPNSLTLNAPQKADDNVCLQNFQNKNSAEGYVVPKQT